MFYCLWLALKSRARIMYSINLWHGVDTIYYLECRARFEPMIVRAWAKLAVAFDFEIFYKLLLTSSNLYLNTIEMGSNLGFFSNRKNRVNGSNNLTAQNVVNLDPVVNCDHGKFERENKFALLRKLKQNTSYTSHVLSYRLMLSSYTILSPAGNIGTMV